MNQFKKHKLKVYISLGVILLAIIIMTIFDIGGISGGYIIPNTDSGLPEMNYIPFNDTTQEYRDYKDSVFKDKYDPITKSFNLDQPKTFYCIGCHDGVTASDKGHWTSGDIKNHSIGMFYQPGPEFNFIPDSMLENGYVGCTSCHFDHNEEGVSLLRMDNKGSQLCLFCHIK